MSRLLHRRGCVETLLLHWEGDAEDSWAVDGQDHVLLLAGDGRIPPRPLLDLVLHRDRGARRGSGEELPDAAA